MGMVPGYSLRKGGSSAEVDYNQRKGTRTLRLLSIRTIGVWVFASFERLRNARFIPLSSHRSLPCCR